MIRCLKFIYDNQPMCEFEIITVDNASTNGTHGAIGSYFPDVIFLSNEKNLGFAAANNQGIEKSEGQYVLFLNPDTIIHPNNLKKILILQ